MPFADITFITSAWQPHQFPPDTGAEVAFAGRSNAGKSSALNAIVGRKNLARTSKTPGRTQLINFLRLATRRDSPICRDTATRSVPDKMQAHWRELWRSTSSSRSRSLAS